MNQNATQLVSEPNPYGFWTQKIDSATGLEVPGYGANTIFRFPRPVLPQKTPCWLRPA